MPDQPTTTAATARQDHIIVDVREHAGGASWNVYAGDELVASGWHLTQHEARVEAHSRGVETALRWFNVGGVKPSAQPSGSDVRPEATNG